MLTDTKIHSSFPNAQFRIDGFSAAFRLDRNRFGGGVLIYVKEDIPCKQLAKHILSDGMEGIFVEISLRKTKWLLFGGYRPPRHQAEYFLKHVNYALHTYRQTSISSLELSYLVKIKQTSDLPFIYHVFIYAEPAG